MSKLWNPHSIEQSIYLWFDGKDPNSGWIHCSHKANDNRGQYLIATKNKIGITEYSPAI